MIYCVVANKNNNNNNEKQKRKVDQLGETIV